MTIKPPNFGTTTVANAVMSVEVAVEMLRLHGRGADADLLLQSVQPGDVVEIRNGEMVVVNLSEPGW